MKFGNTLLKIYKFLRDTVYGFLEDNCMRMAAALSYYAVFSLPPLLFLLFSILGYFFQSEEVRREVTRNLTNVVGKDNAIVFDSLLTAANKMEPGISGSVIGLCVLVVGASALMSGLQSTLDEVWKVEPAKEENSILTFIIKKLLSLGMLLVILAMLLFSLGFNALLSAFGEKINAWFASPLLAQSLRVLHFLMSFVLLTVLFAVTFKVLPNAPIRWRDAFLGAFVTTILFALGNYLVGIYLGRSNPASAYGAAASLGLILVWIYYAAMIVLYGAEFTRVWAQRHNRLPSK